MSSFPESFLHFIWKYKLFHQDSLTTIHGERVEILKPGNAHQDAGPDFQNARIKIGDVEWVGQVEIHLKTSDWEVHKHSNDAAYSNVILHVVYQHDNEIMGLTMPTLELKNYISKSVINNYGELMHARDWIACAGQFKSVSDFTLHAWLERMSVENLERKSTNIKEILETVDFDWKEAFYRTLARNFGYSVNADSFITLACSLPLKVVTKHRHELIQAEALLFGQAGFLEFEPVDEYQKYLQNEYQFLSKKYALHPLKQGVWKFLRMHMPNFPTVRISQFAALVHTSQKLFDHLLDIDKRNEVAELFKVETSAYWQEHYHFNKKRKQVSKGILSPSFIENITINTLIPFLFVYGKERANTIYVERALMWLEELKPEANSVMVGWNELGIKPRNARESQSLLHLKKMYCDKKRCLECGVGVALLKGNSR